MDGKRLVRVPRPQSVSKEEQSASSVPCVQPSALKQLQSEYIDTVSDQVLMRLGVYRLACAYKRGACTLL